jgi:hypothetical protein
MQLNGVTLTDRHNRPSVQSRVAIRTLFINDGILIDPYDISACTIFSKLSNASPSSIIDSTNGLIKSDIDQSLVLMNFEVSGDINDICGGGGGAADAHDGVDPRVTSKRLNNLCWFPAYVPGSQASGIHRIGVGDYVAVLDGTLNLSGGYNLSENNFEVANGASSVQKYIDVWTVKLSEGSNYQVLINNFELYESTLLALTEPLLVTTSNRLVNKHLSLGSQTELKITTDITVTNRTLDESVKNILKNWSINDVQVKIQKVNEDSTNLPSRTLITDFIATSATSDNTIIYPFDTNILTGGTLLDEVGGPAGTYIVTAKYGFLDQTFVTKPFYFVVS